MDKNCSGIRWLFPKLLDYISGDLHSAPARRSNILKAAGLAVLACISSTQLREEQHNTLSACLCCFNSRFCDI